MMRLVKLAIPAVTLAMLSGCLATNKAEFHDPNETAIDFTKRISVEFSNKLDKVINSTLSSSPVDKGDYVEKTGYFFATSAGLSGTQQAYVDFCQSKGNTMNDNFCLDKDKNVIFMAILSSKAGNVPDGVNYTVAQPKDHKGSTSLNAMAENSRKEIEYARQARRVMVESIQKDKEDEEARGIAFYSKVGRGDRVCSSRSAFSQEYWGFIEDKSNGKYKLMVKGSKNSYRMAHFRPDELTWVDPRQWLPC